MAVWVKNGDSSILADAQAMKAIGQSKNPVCKLAVGESIAPTHNGLLLRKEPRRFRQRFS
jgi:hypothetical protein